jgi:hypothetical protein
MAILFGLPVSGLTRFSPLVQTSTYGPFWLTGGNYGPEGSAVAIIVLLVLVAVITMATRHLKFQWAIPPIVPGGIPVDIDAIARQQHEAAMGPAKPAAPSLIQIGSIPGAITRPITPTPPASAASNTWQGTGHSVSHTASSMPAAQPAPAVDPAETEPEPFGIPAPPAPRPAHHHTPEATPEEGHSSPPTGDPDKEPPSHS